MTKKKRRNTKENPGATNNTTRNNRPETGWTENKGEERSNEDGGWTKQTRNKRRKIGQSAMRERPITTSSQAADQLQPSTETQHYTTTTELATPTKGGVIAASSNNNGDGQTNQTNINTTERKRRTLVELRGKK